MPSRRSPSASALGQPVVILDDEHSHLADKHG